MDFTLKTYKTLLNSLQKQSFIFQTFHEYLENTNMRVVSPPCLAGRQALGGRGASGGKKHKTIILRPACAIAPAGKHDVDKLPENSLEFAQIQHELGIKGTYVFRIIPESFDPEIIEKITELGHEVGYHYE